MERRLGRGLGSLLGQAPPGSTPTGSTPTGAGPADRVHELPVKSIRPNPGQPRKMFGSEQLEELKQSIEAHGVLQPILVRPVASGHYEIVSGERRWRAARLAGLQTIPVVVRVADDGQSLELAIVENVQRQDLDPMEKARGFQVLHEQFGMTHESIAARVGLQRSTIANFVRLLELPQEVQDGVSAGLVSMGHARALLGLKDAASQKAAFEQVVRQELSVRDTERLVQEAGAPRATPDTAKPASEQASPPREAWMGTLEARIREHLGARVELLKDKGYRGRIIVHFNGREDLERIADLLGPKDLL